MVKAIRLHAARTFIHETWISTSSELIDFALNHQAVESNTFIENDNLILVVYLPSHFTIYVI